MRKRRKTNQSGTLDVKTIGGVEFWSGRYDLWILDQTTGKRKRIQKRIDETIGEVAKMSREKAQKKLATIVQGKTGGRRAGNDGSVTFEWYVENVFVPKKLQEGAWSVTTKSSNLYDLNLYVLPRIGKFSLDEITAEILLDELLVPLASTFSAPVVKRARSITSQILDYASDPGDERDAYIVANPAKSRRLRAIVKRAKRTKRPVLKLHEVGRLWRAITDPRDLLIVRIASVGAIPAETMGLQRKNVDLFERTFAIDSSSYFGKHHPGEVKRESRRRVLAMTDSMAELFALRLEAIDQDPETLLFPQRGKDRTELPLWPGQFLKDRVYTIANALGISTRANFQVLRRSFISWTDSILDLKDVQRVAGHREGSSVTRSVYSQQLPEKQRALVERYEKLVDAAADEFERDQKKLGKKAPARVASIAVAKIRRTK